MCHVGLFARHPYKALGCSGAFFCLILLYNRMNKQQYDFNLFYLKTLEKLCFSCKISFNTLE